MRWGYLLTYLLTTYYLLLTIVHLTARALFIRRHSLPSVRANPSLTRILRCSCDEPLARLGSIARVRHQDGLLAQPVDPEALRIRSTRRRPAARAEHILVDRLPSAQLPPAVLKNLFLECSSNRLGWYGTVALHRVEIE